MSLFDAAKSRLGQRNISPFANPEQAHLSDARDAAQRTVTARQKLHLRAAESHLFSQFGEESDMVALGTARCAVVLPRRVGVPESVLEFWVGDEDDTVTWLDNAEKVNRFFFPASLRTTPPAGFVADPTVEVFVETSALPSISRAHDEIPATDYLRVSEVKFKVCTRRAPALREVTALEFAALLEPAADPELHRTLVAHEDPTGLPFFRTHGKLPAGQS